MCISLDYSKEYIKKSLVMPTPILVFNKYPFGPFSRFFEALNIEKSFQLVFWNVYSFVYFPWFPFEFAHFMIVLVLNFLVVEYNCILAFIDFHIYMAGLVGWQWQLNWADGLQN